MTATSSLLGHIRRQVGPDALDVGSDRVLLSRFVHQRDEAAFRALVARHGPMVFGLCRRVLGDEHEAEDAVQATFLVLARKAVGLRHPETLAAWLHGVAYRLALKARAGQVRRRQVESQSRHVHPVPGAPDPLAEVSARELLTLLDAELERLPERYRLPLILCCLEGRSQEEAARLLGWTAGSVKGRLERGRAKLHARLCRRGLSLSAALLAMEATRGVASARLPALLSAAILRAASPAEAGAGPSASVLALAQRSMAGMTSAPLRLAPVLVLLAGLLAGGLGVLAHPPTATQQQADKQTAQPAGPAAPPRPPGEKRQAPVDRYGDPLPPGATARLGTIRLRHSFEVYPLGQSDAFLSVSPRDETTAVYTWRLRTGELLRRFDLPLRWLCSAVDRAGRTLALVGRDERGAELPILLYLVDVRSGKVTAEWRVKGDTYALAFAPDGKTLASTGAGSLVYFWDTSSGKELRRLEADQSGWWRLTFSPDGKTLAAAGLEQRTVQLWDVPTWRPLHTLGSGRGVRSSVVFSPDGKTLASASTEDMAVHLWDVATGKEVRQLRGEAGYYSLAFSPDGKALAAGGMPDKDRQLDVSPVYLWDVRTGKEIQRLPGHVFAVTSLAFSADGKRLISASSSAVARVWDLRTGKELLPFSAPESWITSVAFSPDGRSLASGSMDGTIRLWEPGSGKPARLFEGGVHPQVFHVAFSPDGRTLVSDRSDHALHVWDVATGRERRRFPMGKDRLSYPFAYAPDGRRLAVWHEDGSVRLLDAATGKEQRRLAGAAGDAGYLCFSPDGSRLASLSFSYGVGRGFLHVWNLAGGKERKWVLPDAGPIVFSPDGRTLFGGTGMRHLRGGAATRTFHACDVDSGEDRPFPVLQQSPVLCLAISPDGRMLAWGDAAGAITLWELAASQVRRRLTGHLSRAGAVAFSPDGTSLASGSADTTVLLWDVTGRPVGERLGPLSAERLSALWDDLADKDAGPAFDALGRLTAAPEQAVALLKTKLRPAPPAAEGRQITRWIADLDSDVLAARQKAMAALRQLGERGEPALRKALGGELTLEARKRVEELLQGVHALAASPEYLRTLRAVEALEHIGTPEAQKVLETLADGAPTAGLTRAAKAALQRLRKKQAACP